MFTGEIADTKVVLHKEKKKVRQWSTRQVGVNLLTSWRVSQSRRM